MAFSTDYAAARAAFREAAGRLGWSLQACPIPAPGPVGETLTVDAACSPPDAAERVLVVSSGIHGVEGRFGSAVQHALLERWAGGSPLSGHVRCVMVHALNPYGFAWSRRVDEGNVDPNRNFVLQDERYEGSPEGYAQFDALLNPRHPPSRFDLFALRALAAAARHGPSSLRRSLATGQFDFPQGLFFGGHAPSPTRTILERHLGSWIGPARLVVHLDLHTGLGKWGTHQLLVDYPASAAQRARLVRWFGAPVVASEPSDPAAYRARGSLGPWCVSQRMASEYVFAFAEFGTYGNLRIIAGLRAENQAHQWGRPDDGRTVRAKARLRELFCPASAAWRSRALAGGLELVERALEGLASEPV